MDYLFNVQRMCYQYIMENNFFFAIVKEFLFGTYFCVTTIEKKEKKLQFPN